MSYERIRSRWWYILPLFFAIFGGIISYFAIRHDDPKKARNCLILGIILAIIPIIIPLSILLMIPDFNFEEEWRYQIGDENLRWI